MKKHLFILSTFLILLTAGSLSAQPGGNSFGFGISLHDPLGATIKYYMNRTNAIQASVGGSYYGSPRLGADYLWHFNAFNSGMVSLYAGPGLALGFGEGRDYIYKNGKKFGDDNGVGIAARAIVGIDIVPRQVPIDIFVELGPLIAISPNFGSALDVGLGIRFYP